jgi:hypothetical protein
MPVTRTPDLSICLPMPFAGKKKKKHMPPNFFSLYAMKTKEIKTD